MRSFILTALLLCACPPSPPKVVAPVAGAPLYPTCTIPDGGALPTFMDVCDGIVTDDNRACVKCPAAHGCLEKPDFVYCVVGNDCMDPKCHAASVNGCFANKR